MFKQRQAERGMTTKTVAGWQREALEDRQAGRQADRRIDSEAELDIYGGLTNQNRH